IANFVPPFITTQSTRINHLSYTSFSILVTLIKQYVQLVIYKLKILQSSHNTSLWCTDCRKDSSRSQVDFSAKIVARDSRSKCFPCASHSVNTFARRSSNSEQ